MSRIKGKYIALIVVEFDLERVPGMNSLSEIQMPVRNGEFAHAIKEEITELSEGKVTILIGILICMR